MMTLEVLFQRSDPELKDTLRVRRGPIRIFVVDDHPAIQEALAATVSSQADLELVGSARTAAEGMQQIRELQPDVVVVDISLEDAHGLDLVHQIRVELPETQVVIFSMYDEVAYAERAIRAGAMGYVMKSESTQSVVEAIRTVMQGEVYLSHRMASRILSKVVRGRNVQPHVVSLDTLTDREMAVFQLLGQGYSIEEIMQRLNLSRKTVETYRRRAKEKLGFSSVGELLQFAVQWTYRHTRQE